MITEKQQKLLIEIFHNGGQITRLGQDIYKSHSFYDKIGDLKKMGLIFSECVNDNNGSGFRPCRYILTNKGLVLVKILIGGAWF